MEPLEYTVQRIPVERTLALRQAVLRPYLGDERFILDDDRLSTTVAFGAVTPDDQVISVARLTPEQPPFDAGHRPSWRLRGMATSPDARNFGVGAELFQAMIGHLATSGGGILWCNARLAARRFYERGGMEAWGEPWDDLDIGPHVVMWREVPGALEPQ
ncbi:MAG TPA: GNAT family N-acetyltransferase [Solirubrobacteraceae bacterium]|nr:GNAT family N-acetyltransferase [Solirubrobacteraceae bacterium]